jgi:DNA-binding HxlR family transcriptional regulator
VTVKENGQLGVSILRLLAEGSTIQILQELTNGPLRPNELEQRLPDVAHSALMRRLAELAQKGAVTHERIAGLPPRAYYSLADAGQALLQIPEASERWERRWSQARRDAPDAWPLRLLADERARAIMRMLADEPLRPIDLERRPPGVGRSATRRRLGPLLLGGILTRTQDDGQVRYALTPGARRLGLIKMLAAHWEWHWTKPGHPLPVWDLPGLLRLLAPATRISESLVGVCRLQIDSHGVHKADIYLAAQNGKLAALPLAPEHPPHADGHAPPQVWCDALLRRHLTGITTTGNWMLMADVLSSVNALLAT